MGAIGWVLLGAVAVAGLVAYGFWRFVANEKKNLDGDM